MAEEHRGADPRKRGALGLRSRVLEGSCWTRRALILPRSRSGAKESDNEPGSKIFQNSEVA